jgi:tubulin monoglycylase TTLL3/8
MWHSEEFAEYLREQRGGDFWDESIKPKVKNIVKWSLESAQDMIEHRKNSCELFGYDIMIDENLNPWLIEINSSPAMDYSTPITKRLVKEVMEDCIKVLVDYGYASGKKKQSVNTGNFTLIYKAKRTVERPHQAFGLNLVCEGKPLK